MVVILTLVTGFIIPILLYKLAVKKFLIETVKEKIILVIVIYVSTVISMTLSEILLIPMFSYLAWSLKLGFSFFWILVGGIYLVICWKSILFLAEKILKE
jgi:hypothetical protein